MDGIEPFDRIFHRIAPYEGEWIPGLRLVIDANDIGEAGAVVSHRGTAGTAKEIEKPHALAASMHCEQPPSASTLPCWHLGGPYSHTAICKMFSRSHGSS